MADPEPADRVNATNDPGDRRQEMKSLALRAGIPEPVRAKVLRRTGAHRLLASTSFLAAGVGGGRSQGVECMCNSIRG